MSVRSDLSSTRGPAALAALLLAASALALPAPALADRWHRGHGHGNAHWHGHGGPRVSIYLGAPIYHRPHYVAPPVYYAPPIYHAPRVIYSEPLVYSPPVVHVPRVHSPPVYVERNDLSVAPPAPAPEASGFWFFCADSNTYYPYVTQCATPWERVSPTPPSAGR